MTENPKETGAEYRSRNLRYFRRTATLLWAIVAPFVALLVVLFLFGVVFPLAYPRMHDYLPDKMQLQLPVEGSKFLTTRRVALITKQAAIVAMGALGITIIIISGGIDLSAGSLVAMTAVTMAVSLRAGVDPVLAMIIVLAVGAAAGALNGALITGLHLVPFIVTLGTMLVFRGMAHWLANQKRVYADAPAWPAGLLDVPPKDSWQFVCIGVWMVIIFGVIIAAVLRFTVFGRYVHALGSNEATARLCGINVTAMKIAVYSLSGLFVAMAGIFDFSYLNKQGNPNTGIALELEMIAAVVIGGGSLSGGRGSILGSIVGALTVATLRNGCQYAGVSVAVQLLLVGGIIIAAVAIDQVVHRRKGQ